MDKLGIFDSQVSLSKKESARQAEVFLDKDLDLAIRIPSTRNELFQNFLSTDIKIKFPGSDWVDCILAGSDDSESFMQLRPMRTPLIFDSNEQIVRAEFLIGELSDLPTTCALNSKDWSVEINRNDAALRHNDNSRICPTLTHRGTLHRKDGNAFSSKQAEQFFSHFCRYLSFCYERWVGVANVEGVGSNGKPVYRQLGAGKIDRAEHESNWLDGARPEPALQELFPGFMDRMANPIWEETMNLAVYWYVRGDTSTTGPDGSLILLQAALERLAWQLLVIDTKTISKRKLENMPAADALRSTLQTSLIPLDVPSEQILLKQAGWSDGADVVVQTRNRLVHPTKKIDRNKFYLYGAYTLAKWYVELVLLRACGFNGNYSNRTRQKRWKGQTEPVPWT